MKIKFLICLLINVETYRAENQTRAENQRREKERKEKEISDLIIKYSLNSHLRIDSTFSASAIEEERKSIENKLQQYPEYPDLLQKAKTTKIKGLLFALNINKLNDKKIIDSYTHLSYDENYQKTPEEFIGLIGYERSSKKKQNKLDKIRTHNYIYDSNEKLFEID